MAIRNGTLYIGNASNQIGVISSYWTPVPFKGGYKLSINDSSTFKVTDESAFFGAYSANTAVKNKIYNDLRFQVNTYGKLLKSQIEDRLLSFSFSDPQYNTFLTLRNSQQYTDRSTFRYPLQSYTFNNSFKFYVSATFDDVALIGKISVISSPGIVTLNYA